jgi:plasmid stabilization system protein ParE
VKYTLIYTQRADRDIVNIFRHVEEDRRGIGSFSENAKKESGICYPNRSV